MTNDEAEALKVGDMVVCVSDSHEMGFIVGNKYEIKGISERGNPYVHLDDQKFFNDPNWYLVFDYCDDFEIA